MPCRSITHHTQRARNVPERAVSRPSLGPRGSRKAGPITSHTDTRYTSAARARGQKPRHKIQPRRSGRPGSTWRAGGWRVSWGGGNWLRGGHATHQNPDPDPLRSLRRHKRTTCAACAKLRQVTPSYAKLRQHFDALLGRRRGRLRGGGGVTMKGGEGMRKRVIGLEPPYGPATLPTTLPTAHPPTHPIYIPAGSAQ